MSNGYRKMLQNVKQAKKMAEIICNTGFFYGDQLIAFYNKQAIKIAKDGKHIILPLVENELAGPGKGFQVSDFTWINKDVAKQIFREVKKKISTDKMSPEDKKLLGLI